MASPRDEPASKQNERNKEGRQERHKEAEMRPEGKQGKQEQGRQNQGQNEKRAGQRKQTTPPSQQ